MPSHGGLGDKMSPTYWVCFKFILSSNVKLRATNDGIFTKVFRERERDADSTTTLTNLVTYTLKRQYAVVVDRPRLTDPSLANRRSPSYCHTAGTGNI